MFEKYATRPSVVRALQVGENVGDLFRVAGAIVESGGQAVVEVSDESYFLKVLVKDRTNMSRVYVGQWLIMHENREVEILSDQEFRAAYWRGESVNSVVPDSYDLPLTESAD